MNLRASWLIILAGISHDVALIEWLGAEDCLKSFFTQASGVWEKTEQLGAGTGHTSLSLLVLPYGLSNMGALG